MSFSAASLHAALDACVPLEACGLVVGLSGGPDSAALLAAAAALGEDFRRLSVRAVHIDHGLQAAAAGFRSSCQALCEHVGVPLSIIAIEVTIAAGESLEARARDARYAALAAQLQPGECLLTAHHREDQAQTLLLQALRGAGIKGMAAMPACRALGAGWHARPLLDVARNELAQFAQDLRRFQSIDPMNEDLRFDRVYLRKQIWSPTEQRWPGAGIALARAAGHLADAQQLLDFTARADVARLRDGAELSVPGLRCLAPLQRANAVRLWLSDQGLEVPSARRLRETLRQILDAGEDQQPAMIWAGKALRRYRQRMFVTDADPPRLDQPKPWAAMLGASIDLGARLGSLTWTAQIGGIAVERLPPVLVVRRREGGEALKPARMAKTQSLQHLCQSWGVLPWMRDALPLVFAGDELVAVADMWTDARWCAAAAAPGLKLAWHNAPQIS